MEKATYPSCGDRATISRLLPQVPSDTNSIDKDLELLRISSIVDGTKIRGVGMVGSKSYSWKMAIESAVKSIAVVPDRFFDVTGRSYSIDWNRKISADSLPDYENYKDAIIYRINTRSDFMVPPIAEIIFDNEMQNRRGTEQTVVLDLSTVLPREETEEGEEGTIIDGSYNLFSLLAKTNNFYEKGILIGTVADSKITLGGELADGTAHYVLCPKDRVISVKGGKTIKENNDKAVGDTEISIRVFTLNTYGIEKYLNNDKGNLVKDYDAEGSLVTYLQNHATTNLFVYSGNGDTDNTIADNLEDINTITAPMTIDKGDYLAIVVDANDNYHALIGKMTKVSEDDGTAEDKFAQGEVTWYKPATEIDVSQFKGIDMWLRFESINEMIYFLITKYEQDILEIRANLICPKDETPEGNWDVNRNVSKLHQSTSKEDKAREGRLWAYINPRTMKPYPDDYWFHDGDPYYVRSLTLSQDGQKIKSNRIVVKADQWPGMYMMVGETRIRNRDTGKDERMQIKFPLCKVKSDQTLTLSADGDPTTFNLDLEVARPRNGHMMELTTYEVASRMIEGENGYFYAVDGSSQVVTE